MITVLPADASAIQTAADALRRGALVAFPTETVYGLGADATNEAAVSAVYRLKNRPPTHPLIVHLATSDALWQWADAGHQASVGLRPALVEDLVAALWPGPLTVVLRAAATVPRVVTGGQATVALRVPANETALALLTAFGGAVVAPSANRFGRVSPTTASHVADEFKGAATEELLILDGGATRLGLESTVIDLTTTTARLLRPGSLPVATIESVLGTLVEPGQSRAAIDVPRAPGTLQHHYAPTTPLRIVHSDDLTTRAATTAVIARTPDPGRPGDDADGDRGPAGPWLQLPADAEGFGRGLYAAIRQLDTVGASAILVEEPPAGEEWLAVRDRLGRAAAAHSADGGM